MNKMLRLQEGSFIVEREDACPVWSSDTGFSTVPMLHGVFIHTMGGRVEALTLIEGLDPGTWSVAPRTQFYPLMEGVGGAPIVTSSKNYGGYLVVKEEARMCCGCNSPMYRGHIAVRYCKGCLDSI